MLSSSSACHSMLLQLRCSSSSCCRALAAALSSSCKISNSTTSRINASDRAGISKGSASAPSRHVSRGFEHQQAASSAVLQCLKQQEKKEKHDMYGGMPCQAAAAGPGAAMPLLRLRRLLLPSSILLPQEPQLGARGLSSCTFDRWQPGGTANRQPPGGRRPRVLVGRLCAQAESLQELQQLLHEHADDVVGISVAAAYTRCGKLCQWDAALVQSAAAGELLQHLDQLLPSVQEQLGARQLSNIIWSCAYTQHTSPLVELLADFMQPTNLSAANSHGVGNVLWALATLGQHVLQQQLQQLTDALVRTARTADPQHISNSMWALGKLGYQMPQHQLSVLLAAFTAEGMLSRADTQNIANLLLGVVYMSQQLPDAQLQLLVAAFVSKRSRAKAQELANVLWAVSELGQQVLPEQLEQLLAAIVKQLHKAVPQEISNTLLACARFRYVPVQLLVALQQQQQQQQQHMQRFLAAANPQHLANTAWACGVLRHNSELLLGGVLQQAVKLLQQDSSRFACQNLCNLYWAVAVLDLRQYVPEVLLLAEAASRVWRSAAPENLQQLYQVHLWLLDLAPAEGGKGPGLLQVLSQQQLDECRKLWQDQVAGATPSAMQQQVFKALQQLPGWQVPPQQEELTDERNFSIDIVAVTAAGVRLAVEVDGPHHFVRAGNKWEVGGPTRYRDRALTARGYTVISIPYWDWNSVKGSEQQQGYLKGRLPGLTPSAEPVSAGAAAGAVPADQPPSTATQASRRRDRSAKRKRDSSH